MPNIIGLTIIIAFGILGALITFSPAERLIETARKAFLGINLPMPPVGSKMYTVLIIFYRSIGVFALAFSLLVAYSIFMKV